MPQTFFSTSCPFYQLARRRSCSGAPEVDGVSVRAACVRHAVEGEGEKAASSFLSYTFIWIFLCVPIKQDSIENKFIPPQNKITHE